MRRMQLEVLPRAVIFLSLIMIWCAHGQEVPELVAYGCIYEHTNMTLNCIPPNVISLIKDKTVMLRDKCAISSTCCGTEERECAGHTADVKPKRWRDLIDLCNGKQHCWIIVDWVANNGCFTSDVTSNNELITYTCQEFKVSSTQTSSSVTEPLKSSERTSTNHVLSTYAGEASTSGSDGEDNDSGGRSRFGAIIGGVVAVVLITVVIVVIMIFWRRCKSASSGQHDDGSAGKSINMEDEYDTITPHVASNNTTASHIPTSGGSGSPDGSDSGYDATSGGGGDGDSGDLPVYTTVGEKPVKPTYENVVPKHKRSYSDESETDYSLKPEVPSATSARLQSVGDAPVDVKSRAPRDSYELIEVMDKGSTKHPNGCLNPSSPAANVDVDADVPSYYNLNSGPATNDFNKDKKAAFDNHVDPLDGECPTETELEDNPLYT